MSPCLFVVHLHPGVVINGIIDRSQYFLAANEEEQTSSSISVSMRESCVANGVPVDDGVVPPLTPPYHQLGSFE